MNNLHRLSGGHVILDIIGNLVANIRQFQQFLFDRRQLLRPVFGIFELRLEDNRPSPCEAPNILVNSDRLCPSCMSLFDFDDVT